MIFAIFAVSLAAFGGYAQEMPEEIKAFLENYTKDSTEKRWGPLRRKEEGVIPATAPIRDLRFRVLQVYYFRKASLQEHPDDIALSEVIEPSGFWRIVVMAHNQPRYELTLDNRTGKPKIIRTTLFAYASDSSINSGSTWGPLLKTYPESTGINPVLVEVSGDVSGKGYSFLYFKQLGSRKIFYGNRRGYNPTFDSLFTASIETLDDSNKLVNWKKHDIMVFAEECKKLEKTKSFDRDESSGSKRALYRPAGSPPEIQIKDAFQKGGGQ
jgi:hypothetical protein